MLGHYLVAQGQVIAGSADTMGNETESQDRPKTLSGQRRRPWQAEWIWPSGPPRPANCYASFRHEFELKKIPSSIRLRLSADTRYTLFLNGRRIFVGPPQSTPWFYYYDEFEPVAIKPHLREGINVIAVTVYHIGRWQEHRGGLLLELYTGKKNLVLTNQDWKCIINPAWEPDTRHFPMQIMNPYQEVYDARQDPGLLNGLPWQQAGFDDSRWPFAEALGKPPYAAPWGTLHRNPLPFLEKAQRFPIAVVHTEEARAQDYRMKPLDLTPGISAPGRSKRFTTCEYVDTLTRDETPPALMQCAEIPFDSPRGGGIYDPSVTLDFGDIVTAYLDIDFEGPAGAVIDIGFSERLTDGRFLNSVENYFAVRFVHAGGRVSYRTSHWHCYRFIKLRLRDCYETGKIHNLRAITIRYPFQTIGKFACQDDQLNAIWDISRTTLQLCCVDAIYDTPWRESGQWLGDVSAVTLGGIYACFGDTLITEKFFRQSSSNQRPNGLFSNISNAPPGDVLRDIPDYSLWWVRAVYRHFLYSGNILLFQRLYPAVCKAMQFFVDHMDRDGLLTDVPGWVFIDWADLPKKGKLAHLNAIFRATLDDWEIMAAVMGDTFSEELAADAGERLHIGFNSTFFHKPSGCFFDAVEDDRQVLHFSEHTNLMAIQAGLANEERTTSIIEAIYDKKTKTVRRAEPFFTWQILKGLESAGRFDLALALLKERWGWMVARGAKTVSEEWSSFATYRDCRKVRPIVRTESHAWSACPAEALSCLLSGLKILEPGCTRIRLRPHTKVLGSFLIHYPTPLGVLEISARDGKVSFNSPKGMAVELDKD